MISVILPAHDEEKNIGHMINSVSNFFKKINLPCEIIVVNDGSQDGTGNVLNSYKKNDNIVIVSHIKNLGYGAALRSGFGVAKGELIFFTDSDCQFDIKDIMPFLEKIKDNDFVIGYRKNRKDPLNRILNAKIFRFMAMIFLGIKVKDIDCAFKLFNNYVLSGLELFSEGALINLEILSKAQKRGYKFIELPVSHFERKEGKQTGGSFKVVFKAVFQFLNLLKNIKDYNG